VWVCRHCGSEVEDKFTDVTTCWKCGAGKDGSPPPAAKAPNVDQGTIARSGQQMTAGCGCLLFIVLAIVVGLAINHQSPEERQAKGARDQALDAYFMAQEFVKANLKTPATAKFPLYPNPGIGIIRQDDGGWLISGYVDSQNAFGALIRTKFICAIKEETEGKWRLQTLRFLE